MENIGQGYSAQTKAIDNLFSDVKPWGIYDASLWNGSILPEARGNGRNVTSTGTITYSSGSGNGATASIPSISGDINSTMTWSTGSWPTNFTICCITRYTNTTNRRRIISSKNTTTNNGLLGHYSNTQYAGALWNGSDKSTYLTISDTNWLVSCAKSAATTNPNTVIMNGIAKGNTTGGPGGGDMGINTIGASQSSDFAFTYLVIYDSALLDDQMITLSDQLRNYLITGSLIVTNGFFSQSIAANNVAVSTTNLVNYWTVSSINTFYLAKIADTTYTRGTSTTYPYVALPSIATQFLVSNLTSTVSTHSITQSVNIDVAGVYTLTFYHTGRSGATSPYATTHTLSVDIGPKNIVTALQTTNTGWQLFTGSIVLTSTDIVNNSLKFTFNNSAATSSSFYITGVALNYVAPYVSTVVGTGLLSTIPTGCVGLFACKWVNNNYKGPILTLRRSSDSVLQDFYMDKTGTVVSTGAYGSGTTFATWLGANTAYVNTWYDQSGLGKHATQTINTALQPSYDYTNKRIDFTNNSYFDLTDNVPIGDSSYSVTVKHGAINSVEGHWLCAGIPTTNDELGFRRSTTNYLNYWYATVVFTSSSSYASDSVITYDYNNNSSSRSMNFYKNSANNQSFTPTAGRNTTLNTTTGKQYLGTGNNKLNSECLNGQIYHLSIFNTVLTDADRNKMEGI